MTLFTVALIFWAVYFAAAMVATTLDAVELAQVYLILMWISWVFMIAGLFLPTPLG